MTKLELIAKSIAGRECEKPRGGYLTLRGLNYCVWVTPTYLANQSKGYQISHGLTKTDGEAANISDGPVYQTTLEAFDVAEAWFYALNQD